MLTGAEYDCVVNWMIMLQYFGIQAAALDTSM